VPVRAFEGAYPEEVAGLVLVEASSEPEVPVYERLHAGRWIDDADRTSSRRRSSRTSVSPACEALFGGLDARCVEPGAIPSLTPA
jgi:hypothetical protein